MPTIDPFANKGPQDVASSTPYSVGPQLFDPALYAGGGGHSYVDGLTAAPAAGGQAGALPLTQSINRFATTRFAGDCAALPAATGGQIIVVRNAGNQNLTVYAANGSSDLINSQPGSTGVTLATMQTAMFCSAPGRWFWLLSA